MVLVTGAWAPNSSTNQRMRLRIDYNVPTPTAGQTSVTVTGTVYLDARYSFNDSSNTFAWSGSLLGSGSTSKSVNVATDGTQAIHTFSKAVTLTSAAQGFSLAFSLTGIEYVGSGTSAVVSTTVSVPARAIEAPNAPSVLNVSQVSSTRHRMSWPSPSTSQRPVSGFYLEQFIDGSSGGYVRIASPGASTLTYDINVVPNKHYHRRIMAWNSVGASTPRYSEWAKSSPTASTTVKAVRSGSNANITWKNTAPYAENQIVQRGESTNGGASWGNWTNIATLSANSTSYSDTNVPAGKDYIWRVVTRLTGPEGYLYAYSGVSNSIGFYSGPAAPTGVSVVRNSDGSHTINYSASSTAAAPITGFDVERRRRSVNGTGSFSGYTTLSGGSRSFNDNSTVVDDEYAWRIRSTNQEGSSAWVTSPTVKTTPAKATNVKAARSGATNVLATWAINAKFANTQSLMARSSTDGGATWGTPFLITGHIGFSATATSRTITNLSTTQLHQIQVVSNVTNPGSVPNLTSESAWSSAVQLLAPPLEPTVTGPVVTTNSSNQVMATWDHNPVDGSDQTAYELEYKLTPSGTPTVLTGTTAELRTFGPISAGDYEMRIRTKGAHTSFGPWSTPWLFSVANAPIALVLFPSSGGSITTNRVPVMVLGSDPSQAGIVSWSIELLRDGVSLETKSGTGEPPAPPEAPDGVWMDTELENLTSYQLRTTVTSGSGLTSGVTTTNFSTDFIAPMAPKLDADWVPGTGEVQMSVTNYGEGLVNLASNPSFEEVGAPVELRRNYFPDPDFATNNYLVLNRADNASLELVDRAVKVTVIDDSLENGVSVRTNFSTSELSEYWTASVDIWGEGPSIGRTVYLRTYDTSYMSAVIPATLTAEPQRVEVPAYRKTTAPGGGGRVILFVYFRPPGDTYALPAGESFYISNPLMEIVSGTGLPSGPFFSGTVTPDPDMIPSWTGNPNSSESILSYVSVNDVPGGWSSTDWAVSGERSLRVSETLQVGGRNYIAISKGLGSYLSYNTEPVASDGGRTIKWTKVSNTLQTLEVLGWSPETGVVYTISGRVEVDGVIPETNPFTSSVANTYSPVLGASKTYDPATGAFSFTANTSASAGRKWVFHSHTSVEDGSEVTLRDLKMEVGSTATDWSPAPEDWSIANLTAGQRMSIVARNAGQQVFLDGVLYHTTTRDEEVVWILDAGHVGLGEGWWDNWLVIEGNYDGPWFEDSGTTSVENRIEIETPQGEWVPLVEHLSLNAGVNDFTAKLNYTPRYRAVSISPLGVESYSPPVTAPTPVKKVVWLNSEDGFTAVRLWYNLNHSFVEGADVVFETYLGDNHPTAHYGPEEPTTVAVTCRMTDYKEIDKLRALKVAPLYFRSWDGHGFLATFTEAGLSVNSVRRDIWDVSFELRRVNPFHNYSLLPPI